MPYLDPIPHATGEPLPASDWNQYVRDDFRFLHDRGADLASAATLTPTTQWHRVTGTVTITALAVPSGTGQGGNRLLLKFQSAGCAITAGAALILTGGPFVSVVNAMIEFVWDDGAAVWVEVARQNGIPVLDLSYVTQTTDVAVAATTQATATTIVTAAAITADGTSSYEIMLSAYAIRSGTTYIRPVLYKDAAAVVDMGNNNNAAGISVPFERTYRDVVPAAGSHTYSFRAYVDAGSGTVVATGVAAAFIRVRKVV